MYNLTHSLSKAQVFPSRREASEAKDKSYHNVKVKTVTPTHHHIEVMHQNKLCYVKSVV